MASLQAQATRRAVALQKLQEAKVRIGEQLGLESQPPVLSGRDAELAQIQQVEDVTAFLERASIAIEQQKPAAEKPKTPKKTIADE